MMQRVSLRTLVLVLELLLAVVSLQYLTAVQTAEAGAVWLADTSPIPTSVSAVSPEVDGPRAP